MFPHPPNHMTPPPMRRVWSWMAALGCVYVLALLSFHLAHFPGLHGDEAWLGLFALRIRDQGLYSPHEMNTYTGSLYAWLLSWVFTLFPPDVFSLRIGGVLLNGAAVVIATWHFAKRFGLGSALVWLYLLGTSALFVFKSRLAWEVTALQNLLLMGILVLCARFLEDRRRAFGSVLAFLVLNYIGVINHFIFISVPVSLALVVLVQMIFRDDGELGDFCRLSLCNGLMAALVFLVKSQITETQWQHHQYFFTVLALLIPLGFAAVYVWTGSRTDYWLCTLCTRYLSAPLARTLLKRGLAFGLVLFCSFHLKALMQVWSAVVLFEHLASWSPPLFLQLVLYAWACSLLGTFALYTYRRLEPGTFSQLSLYARLLALWPAIYLAVFILFRDRNHIRYYILPSFLIMASLTAALSRIDWAAHHWVAAVYLGVAAVLNLCFWGEVAQPSPRPPLVHRIGWHLERSADFLPKDSLYQTLVREKICTFQASNFFINLPLAFYLHVHPIANCDRTKVITVQDCPECPDPPYFAWTITSLPAEQ
jgi:hypothetical protein